MFAAARLTLSATLAAAVLAIAPAAGWADADPPSDVLLGQDVYLPYQPAVSKPLGAALRATVARAKQANYPLKVAIVGSEADLGAIPNLFNRPAAYAPFLARELPPSNAPTLVVMPAGLAAAKATQPAVVAIRSVRVDKDKKSDGLVRAAIQAIPRMATASGHPLPETKLPAEGAGKSGSGGTSPLIVFGAPVVLVALAALIVGLRRHGLDDEDEDETASPREGSGGDA